MNLFRILKMPKSRLIKKLFGYDEVYQIAIRKRNKDFFFNSKQKKFKLAKVDNVNNWYADPILVSWEGNDYLFVETYDRTKMKGHISVAMLKNENMKLSFKKIICEKYHMSFPMVFQWNNCFYMIPETSENCSINIYKAINMPYKWKLVSSFDIGKKIVDSVVIKKDRKYISVIASELNRENELECKYYKYKISSDFRVLIEDECFNRKQKYSLKNRNAGNVISYLGENYLPTQISSKIDYGIAFGFRKIVSNSLCSDLFIKIKQPIVKCIKRSNIVGFHSYSISDNYEIIDLRYLKYSPKYLYRKILIKTKGLLE